MNWFLLSFYHLTLMSFCTEGIPARSCRIHCYKKRRKTFSLERRCPSGRMRGGGKCSSKALTHRLRSSLLSRSARVILWMMDSATSPCGCAQNDRVGGILRRLKVFGFKKPTKRESGAMCIGYGMMLCVLVWIDAM